MTTTRIEELRSFCVLAEHGSFTLAARVLGVDKSKVSRDVAVLEGALGTLLAVRTTRSFRLTPEGQTLYERAAPAFGALGAALDFVSEGRALPSGEITLTTTPELAREVLARVLVRFRARYPGIQLRLILHNALVDLAKDHVDLALRVGRPGTGAGTARKLAELRSGFFGAPSYLGRRGVPARIEALSDHEGLWPSPARGQKSFSFDGRVPKPAFECSDFEMLRQLGLAGAGIALLPEFLARRDVESGALVRVLEAVTLGAGPLFLVSQAPRKLSARVTLLREFLLRELPSALPG